MCEAPGFQVQESDKRLFRRVFQERHQVVVECQEGVDPNSLSVLVDPKDQTVSVEYLAPNQAFWREVERWGGLPR